MKITDKQIKDWESYKELHKEMHTWWNITYSTSYVNRAACMQLKDVLFCIQEGNMRDVELIDKAEFNVQ